MGRKVKCKICKTQLDSDIAYCIEKTSSSNRTVREYYCSQQEYEKDKEEKELWRLVLVAVDDILGYTCISKTKVNMIKEIEEHYSRRQLYNCLINHKEEIKRYLDEKGIYEEYGKLSYIFACIRNKIKDDSNNIVLDTSFNVVSDYEEETNEELEERIKKMKKKKEENNYNLFDIIKSLNKRE